MKTYTLVIIISLLTLKNSAQSTFQKIYGQTIYQEGAYDIQKTFDGGYMIGGYAYRPQTYGANDLYLLKLNNAGVIQYGRMWGRTGYFDAISSIRQTSDSGFIMLTTGRMSSGSPSSSIVKTDAQGAILWNKSFQNGTSSIYNANLEITSDGNFIVATSQYLPSLSQYIVNLQKLDVFGDTVWTRVYSAFNSADVVTVKQTSDGGYLIAGNASGTGLVLEPFLIKVNSSGDIQWYKSYSLSGVDYLSWFEITNDGGFIFCGNNSPSHLDSARIFVVKTDSGGNPSWGKIYNTNEAITSNKIMQTSNGGFLITGVWVDSTHLDKDVYALKIDDSGNTSWSKHYGGPKNDWGESLLDLPGAGHIILGFYGTPNGAYPEVYLIQTDLYGNSGCNENTLTTISNTHSIQTDTIGFSQYWLPYTSSTITYGLGYATDQTTFCSSVGINDIAIDDYFKLYPNPSSSFITVSFENVSDYFQVSIIDILGNQIFKKNIFNNEKINTSGFSNGIYYLSADIKGKQFYKKLIIKR